MSQNAAHWLNNLACWWCLKNPGIRPLCLWISVINLVVIHQLFYDVSFWTKVKPALKLLSLKLHCLTSLSWFLSAGFIGHKMTESDLGHAFILPQWASSVQTATCCPRTANCSSSSVDFKLTDWTQTQPVSCGLHRKQEQTLLDGSNWHLHTVEILRTSWYSKAFICHFLWWRGGDLFTLQHFCFWMSNTESVPIFEDKNGRRWGWDFSFFNAGIDFLPFTMFPLSFLNWTFFTWGCACEGTILFYRRHLSDRLSNLPGGIEIFTTAYIVVGSWIVSQNVAKS